MGLHYCHLNLTINKTTKIIEFNKNNRTKKQGIPTSKQKDFIIPNHIPFISRSSQLSERDLSVQTSALDFPFLP